MGRAVLYLLDHAEARAQMGGAAYDKVRELYDNRRNIAEAVNVIEGLADVSR